ncbi:response regulator FrzS [Myxococcus xanthus DK 1622]|uniref:Response regulator FrzS n=3 Tax=Myxococcus TaxID=32 RepID=Q1D4U9_MYXXD|nr:response regulator [Myxococcus xanthus]ABF88994.1 response regulator FrzS [Myxococcus xanthus DK 1622]NOJ53980.1 response regulator [Myxococcus xanthus]QPM76753.1 response regulator [Myxococcus xanthus]QVW65820.1 response regulator [Myxococcus xanthus DZ2]QZZ51836.1 Chromosome partition protein Smc [Myxococcus xanthus]
MSKKILIVESDTALSATLRSALEGRGFTVDETTDGKGSVEQIRRDRPDLVVLAVDLSAGQNGYLICGKLKKDDDLKNVPIVIIGNPDGFAQHRKLKAHADEYVAKPVDADQLVERAGALIGFPELPATEDVVDESLTLDALGDEPMTADFGEEISVETAEEPSVTGEELDLDAAFGDLSAPEETPSFEEEVVVAPPEAVVEGVEEDFSTLDSLGTDSVDPLEGLDDASDEKTVIGFIAPAPVAAPPPEPPRAVAPPPVPRPSAPARPAPPPVAVAPAADAAELRSLRAKVAELQAELDDSRGAASHAEERVRDLEAQLESQATELETARASSGKNDKDTFALRDAANKKDKEILRLKTELNQKDQEIIELKDESLELEQKASTAESELAQRDAQLKTLSARAESLATDRRRVDQQLAAAKEEARGASAQLTALQTELDQHQAQAHAYAAELEELRARAGQLEADVQAAQHEAEDLRVQVGQAQVELSEQSSRASAEADELRGRIAELEAATARNEERVTRLYARIKSEEKLREKTKKALVIAQQLLDEPASSVADDASEAAA